MSEQVDLLQSTTNSNNKYKKKTLLLLESRTNSRVQLKLMCYKMNGEC